MPKKLTQEEICEITGMDVSNYSKIETGKVAPSLPSLQKLITYAKFSPNELFEYSHLESETDLDKMIFDIYEKLSLNGHKNLFFLRKTGKIH